MAVQRRTILAFLKTKMHTGFDRYSQGMKKYVSVIYFIEYLVKHASFWDSGLTRRLLQQLGSADQQVASLMKLEMQGCVFTGMQAFVCMILARIEVFAL